MLSLEKIRADRCGNIDPAIQQCAQFERAFSWCTSLCATLWSTCGRANRLSCRFVIAKLAALVPKPRVNLSRFHGVFAPNNKHRVDVAPAKRGKGSSRHENEDKTPEQRHRCHDLGTAPETRV
jgi:hypothetical protein